MITLSLKEKDNTMKLYLLAGLYFYKAKGLSQIVLIFLTAAATMPFLETIKKFVIPHSFDNWVIFIVLLTLDVASGLYKHSGIWAKGQKNTLNKDDFFFKLFRKVFAGAVWLELVNVILNLDNSSAYFDSFGVGTLISWLGWSIASNLYVISGSTFPPQWIMSRLRKANEGDDKPK